MSDESLLDVFVNVGAKGMPESEKEVADFISRIEGAFGKLKKPNIGSVKIPVDLETKNLKAEFDEIKKRFASLNTLLSFETRGSLNLSQRLDIAGIEKDMRDVVITFDVLAKKTDKTALDFQKMSELVENFKQSAAAITEIKSAAVQAGASTNSLSNNAYQLGQAFEDAAVGFSLNGITGAVRGAANNVTFLVNNLAQAGELTSLLGSRVATLLPLFTGLGAAGIFIIPSLITWLKKLNEIEEETKDLAELMKKEFEDTEFEVRIKINRLSIEKSLNDARSATESIVAFLRQAEESDKLTLSLKTKIDKAAFGEAAEGVAKLYDDISKALLQRQIDVSQKQFKGVTAEGIAEFADPDPKLVRNIQELQNAFNDAVSAQAKLENDVRGRDFFDPGDIKKAAENLAFLQKNFQEVGKSGVFNAEQLKKIEEEIDVLVKRYGDLQQESRELELINDIIFGKSLRIGQDNLESMTRELQLQSDIESGLADESDRFLFNLNEEYIAVKKLNDEILRRGNNSESAKRLADQNLLEAKLEAELKIRRRIAEVELDIRGVRDDQNGDVKSISRAIDDMGSFVISGDTEAEKQVRALQDLTRELQNLQDALGQVKGPDQGGPAGGGALEAMLQKEIADEQQRRIAERKKIREEQVRRNREKQKQEKAITTESIKGEDKAAADKANKEAQKAAEEKKNQVEQERRAADDDEKKKGITNESIKRNVDAEKKFIDDAAAVLGEMEQQRKIQEPSVPEQPPAAVEDQKTPMQTEMERSAEEAAKAVDELKKQSEQLAEELKREKAAADRRREETALWLRGIEEDLRSRNQANPEEDRKKEATVRPELEAQRERERKMEEEFDAKERASIEESQRRAKQAEEEAIRQDVERWKRLREFGPEGQQTKREPIFAPEDIQAQGNAQANANARAMDNTNFRSTTLQALLETNNQILTKLNENVTKIPGSQGLA